MQRVLECFGDVVGTTHDTDSNSGLYLADLEAVSTLRALEGTEDYAEVLEVMETAIRVAILNLNTDLTTLITKFAKKKGSFKGVIGGKKYTHTRAESGKSGIRLLCAPVKHGEIILRQVGGVFDFTGDVTITVASNLSEETETFILSAVKGKPVWVDAKLSLPTYDDKGWVEYYIYHENPGRFCANKLFCGTCRRFYFNAERPIFKKYGYESYVMASGFNGEPQDLKAVGVNEMKGLMLNVEMKCHVDRTICDEQLDFQSDEMAQAYALAIQHKAGSVALWNIIRSSHLNRVLMDNIETFRDAASYYERKYNGLVRQIADSIDLHGTCFCEKGWTNAWTGTMH
jgi:hypothetical protein